MSTPADSTSWAAFADASPALAEAVAQRFAGHLHHVLGTLAADGRPRLSGLEVPIRDGHLWLGMMPASVKCSDLRRDARFAVHSAPVEVDMAAGDAKVDAIAVEVAPEDPLTATFLAGTDFPDGGPGGGMALFWADIQRVTLTQVVGDALQVQTWTPGGGLRSHTVQ